MSGETRKRSDYPQSIPATGLALMRTLMMLVVGILALAAAVWSLISGMAEPYDVMIVNDVVVGGGGSGMLMGFFLAILFGAVAALSFAVAWKHRQDWHSHPN
jgi:hypothetical protein